MVQYGRARAALMALLTGGASLAVATACSGQPEPSRLDAEAQRRDNVADVVQAYSETLSSQDWESFLRRPTREHSPLGVMGWKATNRITLYPFFLLLPVLWMVAAACLQRVLPERVARSFNRLHTILILALAAAVAYSFISLLQGP